MLGNWVKQTTTTTGTGALTLSSASGFPTFNELFGTAKRFPYTILNSSGEPVECGLGHLSSSTVLVRDFVRAAMVGGVYTVVNATSGQVNLSSGTYTVICAIDDSAAYVAPDRAFCRAHGTANNRILLPKNYISRSASNLTINTANRLYAYPVYIDERGPFDAFCVRVGTAAGITDIGLYEVLETGLPGALVAGSAGVTMSGSAINFATFSSLNLLPGWYFLAFNSSATTQTVYFATINESMGSGTDIVGSTPYVYLAQTQGTLPNPFGTPTAIGGSITGQNVPLIGLRCS